VFREATLTAEVPLAAAVAERARMVQELRVELERTAAQQTASPCVRSTVADYADQWMKTKRKVAKASTRLQYENTLAGFVLPFLGPMFVDAVTRQTVEAWVGWVQQQRKPSGQPYAQETLRTAFRELKTLLRDMAADNGLADPTLRVKPPKSDRKNVRERKTLLPEQLGHLLQVVEKHWPQWYAEVYVLAYTGMRVGELYALEWTDCRPAEHCIYVQRAVWYGHVGTTKTEDPRVVAMPKEMWRVLKEHRQRLVREQHRGLSTGLTFPSDAGEYRFPSGIQKVLAEASIVAELPLKVTPQVLRRTFNTLLSQLGVPGVVVRALMGHTTTKMTQRYAGVQTERKLEAVDVLMEAVQAAPAKK
jgi:integrase